MEEIERLKIKREERRKNIDNVRRQKTEREIMNEAQGIKVDVDFQVMVERHKEKILPMQPVSCFILICLNSSNIPHIINLYKLILKISMTPNNPNYTIAHTC